MKLTFNLNLTEDNGKLIFNHRSEYSKVSGESFKEIIKLVNNYLQDFRLKNRRSYIKKYIQPKFYLSPFGDI